MSKQVNITIDEPNELINLSGLTDNDLSIDYSSDIDFTELVQVLADMIDQEEDINVTCEEVDEEKDKLKVVVETVESIFNKYNESLSIEPEEDDDNLPF